MAKRRMVLACAVCAMVVAPAAAPANRIWIIGDSTAAAYGGRNGAMSGWGEALEALTRDRCWVVNRAVPGASTRTFAADHWPAVRGRLRPGDTVLIQFGHNDASTDARKHTSPFGDYALLLRSFVKQAQVAQARPILLTPIPRFKFDHGRLVDTHGDYPTAVERIASEEEVAWVDLNRQIARALTSVGERQAQAWYMLQHDGKDNVHLSQHGAQMVGRIVVDELRPHVPCL